MQAVVITGVSTGIGFATANLFVKQGVKVFGSVRNAADGERVQKELGSLFTPLLFDVTDDEKIQLAADFTRQALAGQRLWGLINNAGIAIVGALLNMPLSELQRQLDVNLFGQLKVIRAFAPLLGTDATMHGEPGRIINISSVAGKRGIPFLGAYSISKHGLEALSEVLRRELSIYGIDVIIVGPGTITTNIWDKARKADLPPEIIHSIYLESARAMQNYMLEESEKNAMPAEEVAKLLLTILQAKNPAVRYAPVPSKFINWTLPNLLPKRLLDKLITKQFKLINKK